MSNTLPSLLIRLGLVFVFGFAAISGFISPQSYLPYVPDLPIHIMSKEAMLRCFEIFELILAIWLLTGKLQLLASLFATLTIFVLTIVNLNNFNILFRNVAIFFSGLALFVMNLKEQKNVS